MVEMSADEFEQIVAHAMDRIPKRYSLHMKNVGFVTDDFPTPDQRLKLHLHDGQLLFGLYEGIPLTRRGNNYSGVLPDKITIFRLPILAMSSTREDVVKQVEKTVWHEVAHHFGLDHEHIDKLEEKRPQKE